MKTKLLRKLRKEVRNSIRVMYDPYSCEFRVERHDEVFNDWKTIFRSNDSKLVMYHLEIERKKATHQLIVEKLKKKKHKEIKVC